MRGGVGGREGGWSRGIWSGGDFEIKKMQGLA
jgi:hypothetical protein